MKLNHLHLHVRDVARSQRFYKTYFGFRKHASYGEIVFLRNETQFDLALAPAKKVERFPPWFHFGFRLPSRDAVRALRKRIATSGDLYDDSDLVSFRCTDPDGYVIEVYFE